MSWEKKDQPVESVDTPIKEAATPVKPKRRGRPKKVQAEAPATPVEPMPVEPALDESHTETNVHRGRYRFAAWIGLVVILLAIIGTISIVWLGIKLIGDATDNTDLMNELHDFSVPVSYYQPTAFDDLEDADSDQLLLAAIYKITKAEEVRQLREGTGEFSYKLDSEARLIIPTEEITAAYRALFGTDAEPTFNTIGSDKQAYAQFLYDEKEACMHVPWIYSSSSSLYTTVAEDIRMRGKTARVRIGYVLVSTLGFDDFGDQLEPQPENAEYFQWFVFEQNEQKEWHLVAVEDEKTDADATTVSTTTTTTTATTTTTTKKK